MYVLDTDHLSLIQRNGREGKQILIKLTAIEEPEVVVTVITYEEQDRGRLSILSRPKKAKAAIWGHLVQMYSSAEHENQAFSL